MEKLTIKKKRVMMYFIEATQELILSEGIKNISIKKIAEKAGYNTATIYNYFQNLEVLVLYASINYLKNYVNDLKAQIKPNMKAIEIYETVYKNFVRHSFEKPVIFHVLFFGRYSKYLPIVIKKYYQIFPNELEGQMDIIKNLLNDGNIHSRDLPIMKKMIDEGNISQDDAPFIMETIVRLHHSYLEDILHERVTQTLEDYIKSFFKVFYFLLNIRKEEN